MRFIGFMTSITMLALSACGGSDGGTTNVASVCKSSTGMPSGVCDCVGKQAKKDLTKKGQAFVVASLKKEHDKAQALTKAMEFDEVASAGMFLATASTSCALQHQ